MCGVVGIVAHHRVNQGIYDALTMIQHRGQDAAGMITSDGEHVFLRKGNGLVRDVIHSRHMLRLRGNMGIGHVRYPTAGTPSSHEAQPLYVNSPYGLSIVHNGNIINAIKLREELIVQDRRHLNTESDSEVILNIFAHELQQFGDVTPKPEAIFKAVERLHERCVGAYALVIMITGYGIVGIRDPHGIRPICYGRRHTSEGDVYMIASESVALDVLGYEFIDDFKPGEAIIMTEKGEFYQRQCAKQTEYRPCIFEYVYLARPDSVIDGISVYQMRLALGENLADKILKTFPDHDIDVVIPVPDTSRTAAMPLAQKLGVDYREGFVKNRYIGRTFIMPGQEVRKKSVQQKLNTIDLEFKDKNVLLVDDSIVRGTTSKEIIQMARDAGAKKVYFASSAPEVRYPNVYGIDMPSATELIAHNRKLEEITKIIGADRLFFQDLEGLYDAAMMNNPKKITRFEDSIFTGEYTTGGVDADYLRQLELKRSDSAKQRRQESLTMLEIYNNDAM